MVEKGGGNKMSIFVISLDFELHWGGFEKWPLDKQNSTTTLPAAYNRYFINTRGIIPKLLTLFETHEVHATWATVGLLFCDSKSEIVKRSPIVKPTYEQKELSAYHYIDTIGVGEDELSDPFHFAPSLVKKIAATPNQELGTHTFSHFYCNEKGQTAEQFRADLQAAQRIASVYGVQLRSLVFPRNQFNDQYLRVCFEEGITSVRSNPLDWFWKIDSTQQESFWKRLNRGMDAYLPIGKENTYNINTLPTRKDYPICIPASRLLRPFNPREFFLNDFKINRIKAEMTRAAQKGEVYHLWWHPHNFGNYPEQSLTDLQKILRHYDYCRERWSMESMNMGEITELVQHGA